MLIETMASTQEEDNDFQELIEEAKSLGVWRPEYAGLEPMTVRVFLGDLVGKERERLALEREKLALEREKLALEREKLALEREKLALERETLALWTETRDVVRTTVRDTYLDGNVFKSPPIELNLNVTPSIHGNTRRENIQNDDGTSEEVEMKVPEAEIKPLKTDVWLKATDVVIPTKTKDGRLLPSVLGAYYAVKGGDFRYVNEFDVQQLVWQLVQDAIHSLGLAQYVAAHLEIALYTIKPDMVVVLKREGRMFFAIEVKSPGKANEVFESRNPSGQLWSYLYAMKQLGIEQPMGAIMTYDKMVLVTLEDCGTDEQHKIVLSSARATLNDGGVQPTREVPQTEEESCTRRKSSPDRPLKRVIEAVKTREDVIKVVKSRQDENELELEEVELPRTVYYSEIHKGPAVFPSLLQALEVAYRHCVTLPPLSPLLVVRDGDHLGHRLFFKVHRHGYGFVLTPMKYKDGKERVEFRAQVGVMPMPNSAHYYMLTKAGEGHEGTVYVACNNTARLCAIKVYHIEKSSACTDDERRREEDASKSARWETAKVEEERWEKIYSNEFGFVRRKYLGGTPCLLMPYGVEIENGATRMSMLPRIETKLKEIATKHRLRYRESDLRWRNVLLQPKKHSEEDSKLDFFLSDFGSLEEIDEKDNIDEVVKSQMEVLERAIGDQMDALSSPAQRKRRLEQTTDGIRKRKGLSRPPTASTKARLGDKD